VFASFLIEQDMSKIRKEEVKNPEKKGFKKAYFLYKRDLQFGCHCCKICLKKYITERPTLIPCKH